MGVERHGQQAPWWSDLRESILSGRRDRLERAAPLKKGHDHCAERDVQRCDQSFELLDER